MMLFRTTLLAGLALLGCAELPRTTPVRDVTMPDQGWSQADRDLL